MRLLPVGAVVAVAALVRPLSAQTCLGYSSFVNAPARVDLGASVSERVRTYSGSLTVGAGQGLYGGGGGARTTFDQAVGTASELRGWLGYTLPLGAARRWEFCPEVSAGYAWYPSAVVDGQRYSTRDRILGFGVAAGGQYPVSDNLTLVPSVAAALVSSRMTVREASTGTELGATTGEHGTLSLATGIVVNHVVTILPCVGFPIGLEGGKSWVGIQLGIGFGGGWR